MKIKSLKNNTKKIRYNTKSNKKKQINLKNNTKKTKLNKTVGGAWGKFIGGIFGFGGAVFLSRTV